MQEDLEKKITGLVTQQLSPSLFLLDVSVKGSGRLKISVVLDGDEGVTIDECARISRRTGALLDEMDLVNVPFQLEVASPGVDQPLQLKRQYPRNIGRRVEVTLTNGSTHTGLLQDAGQEEILLLEEIVEKVGKKKKKREEAVRFNFEEIDKTTVLVSFK